MTFLTFTRLFWLGVWFLILTGVGITLAAISDPGDDPALSTSGALVSWFGAGCSYWYRRVMLAVYKEREAEALERFREHTAWVHEQMQREPWPS